MPQTRYNLLLDIGNTFLKWGRYRPGKAGAAADQCIDAGHVLHAEIPQLAAAWRAVRAPDRIVISNVAGTRIRAAVLRVLEVWPDAPAAHWLVSQPEQCGVRNGYRNPAQLGPDRWAAMIGARALLDGRPMLVVVCGTATTADFVNPAGVFTGGVILPGLGLMIRSLAEGTATLPDADGVYSEHPTQTVDAIVSGCLHAQAGSVERLFAMHHRDYPELVCVLSGGAAKTLAPRVNVPFRLHENLVLEGLHVIAQTL